MAIRIGASAALVLLAFVVGAAADFTGDLTYYGDNGWAGYCAGNVPNTGKAWPPNGGSSTAQKFALNSAQFSTASCGQTIMWKGIDTGAGQTPPPTNWQTGIITNLCPECKYGDLDMGKAGDGRWRVEWYFTSSGSGGNAVQSSSEARATVPTPKPTYNWSAYLAKARAKRAAAAPTPKPTYNWKAYLTKVRAARAAAAPTPKPTYNWKAYLAKERAARAAAGPTPKPTYNWKAYLAKERAARGRKLLKHPAAVAA